MKKLKIYENLSEKSITNCKFHQNFISTSFFVFVLVSSSFFIYFLLTLNKLLSENFITCLVSNDLTSPCQLIKLSLRCNHAILWSDPSVRRYAGSDMIINLRHLASSFLTPTGDSMNNYVNISISTLVHTHDIQCTNKKKLTYLFSSLPCSSSVNVIVVNLEEKWERRCIQERVFLVDRTRSLWTTRPDSRQWKLRSCRQLWMDRQTETSNGRIVDVHALNPPLSSNHYLPHDIVVSYRTHIVSINVEWGKWTLS